MSIKAKRFGPHPIIHSGINARIGDNINGPSVIRVPDWVPNPLGAYYLYFAHHKGRFIRMAYSDRLEGPWTIHDPGVLDVEQSLFVTRDLDDLPGEPGNDWVRQTGARFLYAHVASPDVHVDNEAKLIRMYYHGLLPDADQQTRLANSADGLTFQPQAPLLGLSYFRVFRHAGWFYAISWSGILQRAKHWSGPFEIGPDLLQSPPVVGSEMIVRHVAVLCRGDRLDLFFTCIGDDPECILHTSIDLSANWSQWRACDPVTILKPEEQWEGADLPRTVSMVGAAHGREHALRDPFVFAEDGHFTLFYSGAGESAIGMARLIGL